MGGKRVGVSAPHKTCFPYGTLCKFPRGINFSNHFFSLTFFLLKKPLPAAFALLSQFFSAVVLSKSFTNNCLLSLFICLLPCHRCSKFLGFKMAVMCVDWESKLSHQMIKTTWPYSGEEHRSSYVHFQVCNSSLASTLSHPVLEITKDASRHCQLHPWVTDEGKDKSRSPVGTIRSRAGILAYTFNNLQLLLNMNKGLCKELRNVLG